MQVGSLSERQYCSMRWNPHSLTPHVWKEHDANRMKKEQPTVLALYSSRLIGDCLRASRLRYRYVASTYHESVLNPSTQHSHATF